MIITIFQLLTVIFLFIILVLLGFLSGNKDRNDRTGKTIWTIESDRSVAGLSDIWKRCIFIHKGEDRVELPEGSFYLGSSMILDDIVVYTKNKIRLYLNVQPDKVLVTVLKGSLIIRERVYEQDQTRQIVINDHMVIFFDGIKITFRKGR